MECILTKYITRRINFSFWSSVLNYSKMLAHRLRGFAEIEHTPSALQKACKSEVTYLEFDTRVSSDNEIYVCHDPETGSDFEENHIIRKTHSSILNSIKYKNGDPFLKYEELLKYFNEHSGSHQFLVIEIKDFGHENKYLDLVKKFNLENRVYWISWIPQSLFELKKIGATSPLILSQWNFMKYPILGYLFKTITAPFLFKASIFVIVGDLRIKSPLGKYKIGFQHSMISTKIPKEMLILIQQSGGGICINSSVVSKRVSNYCHKNKLQLWTYGYPTEESYRKALSNNSIDVAFCENSSEIISE
jgi:glycerophosphoryl diester phosphodiesterase